MIALSIAQGENQNQPEPCKGSLTRLFSLINLSFQDNFHGSDFPSTMCQTIIIYPFRILLQLPPLNRKKHKIHSMVKFTTYDDYVIYYIILC